MKYQAALATGWTVRHALPSSDC